MAVIYTTEYTNVTWKIHSRTTTIIPNTHRRKARETLETNRLKTLNKTDRLLKVLIMDNDDHVTINSWKRFFQRILKHKTVVKLCISLKKDFSS